MHLFAAYMFHFQNHQFILFFLVFGFRYNLTGIVMYEGEVTTGTSGHYVAYARDRNGRWRLYDDLADDVQMDPPVQGDMNPHIIMYAIAE